MGLFRHPHLVRGIVHTSEGAFHIERGVAEIPDEVGEALGWIKVDDQLQKLPQQGDVSAQTSMRRTAPLSF
jgi:hypothetical protein